jgi:hypothetical protein
MNRLLLRDGIVPVFAVYCHVAFIMAANGVAKVNLSYVAIKGWQNVDSAFLGQLHGSLPFVIRGSVRTAAELFYCVQLRSYYAKVAY